MMHPVDKSITKYMRSRRKLLGLSQVNIAGYLGITHQQIQKYESGVSRMRASRLYEMSLILDCDVMDFLQDVRVEEVSTIINAL